MWSGGRNARSRAPELRSTELPPSIVPTFSVVRVSRGWPVALRAAMAWLRMTMGLGAPASVQEWPPGPVTVREKAPAAQRLGDGHLVSRAV